MAWRQRCYVARRASRVACEAAYAGAGPYHLPASEYARDRVLLLPLFCSMTDADQEYVIEQLAVPHGDRS